MTWPRSRNPLVGLISLGERAWLGATWTRRRGDRLPKCRFPAPPAWARHRGGLLPRRHGVGPVPGGENVERGAPALRSGERRACPPSAVWGADGGRDLRSRGRRCRAGGQWIGEQRYLARLPATWRTAQGCLGRRRRLDRGRGKRRRQCDYAAGRPPDRSLR